MYTKLTVVNEMLALLGESAVNSLDDDHDLVQNALRVLDTTNLVEQAREWSFNREILTILPQVGTGELLIPADYINVSPLEIGSSLKMRGRRMYDTLRNTYDIGEEVRVNLVRLIPFEDCPALFQAWVSVSARMRFGTDFDADQIRLRQLETEKQLTWGNLGAEEIRNSGANLLRTPTVQEKLVSMGGIGYGNNIMNVGGR